MAYGCPDLAVSRREEKQQAQQDAAAGHEEPTQKKWTTSASEMLRKYDMKGFYMIWKLWKDFKWF